MILLEQNKIALRGKLYTITSFEVWFIVPDGICISRDEAIEEAEKYKFDPVLIKAVPVAVSREADPFIYEIFMR